MKKNIYPKLSPGWWIELMILLKDQKLFEFSDGIREMLAAEGYKISTEKDGSIRVNQIKK